MGLHRSARRHGVGDNDVLHGHAIVIEELEPDADPPQLLFVGPDRAGRLLEVIALVLAYDRVMVIHARPLRAVFYELLPPPEEEPDA